MVSILSDIRIWITCIGGIIAALIGKIVTSYEKYFEMLFKQNEKIEKKLDDLEKEINNIHIMVSGHIKYHQGLKNGKIK